MKVLFLTQTTELGPASRYRVYQFLPALKAAGVEYEMSPAIRDDEYAAYFGGSKLAKALFLPRVYARRRRDLARFGKFDVAFVQKEFFPLDWPQWKFTGRMIYDFDDAVFGAGTQRLMAASAQVFAGNAWLAERAPQAVVMPTVVDTERFVPGEPRVAETPVVGWMGSRTTNKYLEMIRGALTGWRVKAVSAVKPAVDCEFEAWSLEREVALTQSFDIGLAPLADTEWERGKCGLKTLQYLACGVPVVGSPVGVQRAMIERSGGGLLAASGAEWRQGIKWLATHPAERQAMGERGRAFVMKRYSLQEWAPHWVAAVTSGK